MTFAMLFTGQGSQFAGMGKDLAERFPIARETFAEADEALGEPLSTLCFDGPDEQLGLTENTQPATLTVSVAAYRALGMTPALAAGHSLGEYSALTAAGSLAFRDAVLLVRERARLMQQAVPVGTGGMVVLRRMDRAQAEQVVAETTAGKIEIANLNAPGQIVLSGEMAAVDDVVERLGRSALKLAVSVPFHSSLLADAAAEFATVLEGTAFADPAFPIYCNVDAQPVRTAAEVRDGLRRQFAGSVLWQTSVERMLQTEGVREFVECGPKPVLLKMVGQIAKAAELDGVETIAATTADEVESLRE